jgi:hypothetical protein
MDLNKIKDEKTKEAEALYSTLGILSRQGVQKQIRPYKFQKNIPGQSDKQTLHWTRLSGTSNIGHTEG